MLSARIVANIQVKIELWRLLVLLKHFVGLRPQRSSPLEAEFIFIGLSIHLLSNLQIINGLEQWVVMGWTRVLDILLPSPCFDEFFDDAVNLMSSTVFLDVVREVPSLISAPIRWLVQSVVVISDCSDLRELSIHNYITKMQIQVLKFFF